MVEAAEAVAVMVETEEEEPGKNLVLLTGRTLVVLVTTCLANILQTLTLHTHVTVGTNVGVLEHVVMVSTILYGRKFVSIVIVTDTIPLEELVVMEKMVVWVEDIINLEH